MADQFAAPPINPLISIQPLTTSAPNRDATGVPAQLANVHPGTVVEGFVVNRDAQSNPVLRTILGDILVKSDVFIRTGSQVVFRVDTTQAGHARILTIDGLPPQDYAAAQSRGLTADTITTTPLPSGAASTAAAASSAKPALAAPLQAVLVNMLPVASANNPLLAAGITNEFPIPPALMKLQQGALLQARLLQVQLPVSIPTSSAATAPEIPSPTRPPIPAASGLPNPPASVAGATAAPPAPLPATPIPSGPSTAPAVAAPSAISSPLPQQAVPAITPNAPVVAAVPATPLPPSSSHTLTPSVPPTSPSTVPQQAAQGIPAQVIGREKDGATILHTPIGTLKIHIPQPLPVGSTMQLQLDVVRPSPNAATSIPLSEEMVQVTSLARHWTALEETLTWAQASDPAIAQAITRALPDMGSKLTSGLLFFIAAVKGGDLRQWVGARTANLLETKAPELAGRLKADMGQLQQMFVDSPMQQWNSMMVPMLYHGQLEHARLFFRHDQQEGEQKHTKTGKEQRFVVEVDLSHMGELQFDGFVRSEGGGKQFDLMIRSGAPLDGELAQQIRTTFETALETTGMKGYLGFQHGNQHFVRPMASGGDTPREGTQPILA